MKTGKVELYIREKIKKEGALLSIVIDPCDHPSIKAAIETAYAAQLGGADIIAVGGSTEAQGELLDKVIKGIKAKVRLPITLFPGNIATISPFADAIFFMTLLNSRNPYWISQAQTLSAPLIKKLGVEPLPMGYILVEPGGTAGWVGDANLVPRNRPKIAAALALAGQFSGKRLIFTDAGSNAFAPVPTEMVATVRAAIDIPYVVGGGVKTPEQAGKIIEAGADCIQVGTAAEKIKDVKKLVADFVKIMKERGKEKVKKYKKQ
ncbi:geranylgeranylglyceryl phosphate synthase [Parcubacteria bacterium DG_74_3]|nr:MAG: geranylgeranylglyceryl phosphate synthase [Parcubacteria bacterium DG_74_3]